jgi:hypothetical protein
MIKRMVVRAAIGGATLAAASTMALPAFAATGPTSSGFGQVGAAAVRVAAPVNQVLGTIAGPTASVNVPCPAPWWQGGLLGAKYNACSTATVNQQDGLVGPAAWGGRGASASGFGQVSAAPVDVAAPVNQVVGTIAAPIANVNVPCPAAWNQGGLLGADYNACNTATVNQSAVSGGPLG